MAQPRPRPPKSGGKTLVHKPWLLNTPNRFKVLYHYKRGLTPLRACEVRKRRCRTSKLGKVRPVVRGAAKNSPVTVRPTVAVVSAALEGVPDSRHLRV